MSKCANWQTLDCLRVGNFDSVDVCECAYARVCACLTTAAGITAQQELMRQVTDGAACLCQQYGRQSGWELSICESPGEEGERVGVDGKCQTLLRGTSLISTQTALHLSLAPRWWPLPLTPLPPLTPWQTKSTSRHLHSFFYKQKLPEKRKINRIP